jgi:pilus assembly protein Flp/PilA
VRRKRPPFGLTCGLAQWLGASAPVGTHCHPAIRENNGAITLNIGDQAPDSGWHAGCSVGGQPDSPVNPSNQRKKKMENTTIKSLLQDESGATAIEYGLIAGLVSIAIIAALTLLGGNLSTLFNTVATTVSTASTP